MKEKIGLAAAGSRRSMTAEIINRLDWSLEWFEHDDRDAFTLVRELKSKVADLETENARLRERLYLAERSGISADDDFDFASDDLRQELSFIDEIQEIQRRLERLKLTQPRTGNETTGDVVDEALPRRPGVD